MKFHGKYLQRSTLLSNSLNNQLMITCEMEIIYQIFFVQLVLTIQLLFLK